MAAPLCVMCRYHVLSEGAAARYFALREPEVLWVCLRQAPGRKGRDRWQAPALSGYGLLPFCESCPTQVSLKSLPCTKCHPLSQDLPTLSPGALTHIPPSPHCTPHTIHHPLSHPLCRTCRPLKTLSMVPLHVSPPSTQQSLQPSPTPSIPHQHTHYLLLHTPHILQHHCKSAHFSTASHTAKPTPSHTMLHPRVTQQQGYTWNTQVSPSDTHSQRYTLQTVDPGRGTHVHSQHNTNTTNNDTESLSPSIRHPHTPSFACTQI